MNSSELEKSLVVYEKSVSFPDVSGMEHLDMLLTRSKIEQHSGLLDASQKERLSAADQQLLKQRERFCNAIQRIGQLEDWRQQYDVHVSHWWWFLDVLTFAWPQLKVASSASPSPARP